MSFLLPNPLPPAAGPLLRYACLASPGLGADQTPVPTRVEVADGRLVVTRKDAESGYLLVPWPVGPAGVYLTATSTLRESPAPYRLAVELARGKLNQVRAQTEDWKAIGLQTAAEYDRALAATTRLFGEVILDGTPAADALAGRVLDGAYGLADELARTYVDQLFATRHHEDAALPARLAARVSAPPSLETAADYKRAFNAVKLGLRWRDLEPAEAKYAWAPADQAVAFAQAAGLPVTAGPVVDLSPGFLPDWAAGWAGDLPTLAAFMCDFLETVMGRYRGRVDRWVVCAGFNHADGYGLDDDDRLRLAARLLEAAGQADPGAELVLGLAQPWADYLAREEQTIPPLSFADDLLRHGLRVSALELELRPGTRPRGSLPRDLLDVSRVLDLYGGLGLPLEVLIAAPAADGPDPRAAYGEELWAPGWRSPPGPDGQAAWGEAVAAMALAKPHVRAVTWAQWSDAEPHLSPHAGLVDAHGRVRPLLARLAALRADHLR